MREPNDVKDGLGSDGFMDLSNPLIKKGIGMLTWFQATSKPLGMGKKEQVNGDG